MSQGITATPYFLKCKKCGKIHLYELWEYRGELIEDAECPTCGAKMDVNNVVLVGEEFNPLERYINYGR